jgi:hypothetical protein
MAPASGEVGRDRVQSVREHAVAAHGVAVAVEAVLVVDPPAVGEMPRERLGVGRLQATVRVVERDEVERLAVHRDLVGRRRVDGAAEGRRLELDVDVAIDHEGRQRRQQRHHHEEPGAELGRTASRTSGAVNARRRSGLEVT